MEIWSIRKTEKYKKGHTLNVPGNDWKYEGVKFPEPKYRTAIKAQSESDDEKLGEALNKIHLEDPTIIIEYSKELKQIIVHGQGEYHLNIMKWHLDNIYKIPPTSMLLKYLIVKQLQSQPTPTTVTENNPAVPVSLVRYI